MSELVVETNKIPSKKRIKKESVAGFLFVLPALLGFLIFTLGPMLASLYLSFTDYAIVNDIQFVGFDNYVRLFDGTDPYFYKSIGVTFYYVVLSVPLGIMFHFASAMLMNSSIKGKALFRAIYYVPSLIPVAASCIIWLWMFNPERGLLNYMLKALHLPTLQWIGSATSVVPSIALIAIWMAGNTMVVFLAALQDVPQTLYEAIDIDGGNGFHKLRHITIPMSTPIIFFNTIMGIIGGFQVFVQPMIMTDGGPNNASLFYALYLFREGFEFSKMGSASAMAWTLFIIIIALTGLVFKWSKRWVHYGGR